MPTSEAHPVSAALEAALVTELNRHQIVVWVDREACYSDFVDELHARTDPAPFGAPIVAYRGSYLEVILALEDHASGVDKSPLLVHVPLANQDTIKETPLLEVFSAGYRFHRGLDTLIRETAAGRVPPVEVEAFLAQAPPTLRTADAWMASRVAAASGELAALLQGVKPSGLFDDLRRPSAISDGLKTSAEYEQIWHYLAASLGMRADWSLPIRREHVRTPHAVADALASWALCVEYVHDLRRDPKDDALVGMRDLIRPLVDACGEVARHFRLALPDDYAALALEVEQLIAAERAAGSPGDLGKIDTFRFEEEQLFAGAVQALTQGQWQQAHSWAHDRLAGKSFWLEHDPTRKSAWILVRSAADLGIAIAACKLDYEQAASLGAAAELYAAHGAAIDRLHRQLEQHREDRLYSRVPLFEKLRAALDVTRAFHWKWADDMARGWTTLCEREGALPSTDYQQRRIFEDVVRPLLDDHEKTAFFMVDALRFEMAVELMEEIGKLPGSAVHLRPRLAELPSVTEIGMNVLAPVADGGKLRLVVDKKDRRFTGFQTAAFRVHDPETRRKAIAHRAGGAVCPWYDLAQVLAMSAADLRLSLRQARIAVVHSIEIDAAGEKGAGLPMFAGAVHKLHRAWNLLREAGVQRFVITADHGFLLRSLDAPTLVHGQGHDAMARYAHYPHNVPSADQFAVPLRALQYEDLEGCLLFPRGLEVYQPGKARPYVHGGNSPQERVIPVLTLVHKRAPGSEDLRYAVEIEDTGSVAGVHYIRARVQAIKGQTGLAFAEASQVDLDLRVVDDDAIDRHLIEATAGACLDGDRVLVQMGQPFKLIFRLTGRRPARPQVELFHSSGTHVVAEARPAARFDVEITHAAAVPVSTPVPVAAQAAPIAAPSPAAAPQPTWLTTYDDPGVRAVFAHIETYSSITEEEATTMLGGARNMRAFSRNFEAHGQRAPFLVRIDVVGGIKRYVKGEGPR